MVSRNIDYKFIFSKLIFYLIIFYILFIIGKVIVYNMRLKKEIANINNQIAEIEKSNKDLENLILYYKSSSFREIEARKKLGLKMPGETAVNVIEENNINFKEELEEEKQNLSKPEVRDKNTNFTEWLKFFGFSP